MLVAERVKATRNQPRMQTTTAAAARDERRPAREIPELRGHARNCRQFLEESAEITREVAKDLDRHTNEDEVAGLRVAMTLCNSTLATVFNPQLLYVFVRDVGFQSWCLILHELLGTLKMKINHCNLHNKLGLTLAGPRLRLFFTRLEQKLIRHVDMVQPFLDPTIIFADAVSNAPESESSEDREKALAARLRANRSLFTLDHLIEDEEGSAWWLVNFGKNNSYAVTWENFFRALENHSDPKIALLVARDDIRAALQDALSQRKRKAVTIQELGDFLFRYGPGMRVALVQLEASLESAPWFAGALSFDEARCVLTPHPPGTFLIRFSESSVCTWAVSYANTLTGVVNHALVRAYVPGENEESLFVSGSQTYHSFAELVAAHASQLRQPAPDIKNIGPARLFRGFLSYEQAEDMLEDKPVGTFLIRFSQSQDGCLVVAYVTESEGVLQSKIFTDADRGFILGDRVYRRIAALVSENRDRLQFPLAVEDSLEILGDPDSDAMDEHMAPAHLGYAALPEAGAFGLDNSFESRYGALPGADMFDAHYLQPNNVMLGGGMGGANGHGFGMGDFGMGLGGPTQYEGYPGGLSAAGGGLGVGEGYDVPAFPDVKFGFSGEGILRSAYDAVPCDQFPMAQPFGISPAGVSPSQYTHPPMGPLASSSTPAPLPTTAESSTAAPNPSTADAEAASGR